MRIESSSRQVMFGLNDISGCFDLSRIWFYSGGFRVNQFLVKYVRHAKISNFAENFGSSIIRFGSIRISGPLSGEHISAIGLDMGPHYSVRVSDLKSVLPGLVTNRKHQR